MPRLLLLTSFVLLIANSSFAQSGDPTPSQCLLVRFAAARRYALEHYGAEAVKTGDKCFTKQAARGSRSY